MRKLISTRLRVSNKNVTKIQERVSNSGSLDLEKNPNKISKAIFDVLKANNLIDATDDTVSILIEIKN